MRMLTLLGLLLAPISAFAEHHESADDGWVELFNGRDLTGWKVAENLETWWVDDGKMIARGPRAHMFYVGEVGGADFKDFELKCEVLTKPGANSGLFFHTRYQEEGNLLHGYEVQINHTQGDARKTGSIFKVQDLKESAAKDNEWFTLHLKVVGKRVVVSVDGEVVNDYTEPDDYQAPKTRAGRKFSQGTIALQGHDPGSEVQFRSVEIKLLEPEQEPSPSAAGWVDLFNGKDLAGWRVSENPETIRVEGGEIVAVGPRAHAFYAGDVGGANFKDFELECEILTKPNANSGVYFHTEYQEKGWPEVGYEVQVNQTQRDRIKSGSIYGVQNLLDNSPAKDNQWYTMNVKVTGKRVVVSIDGKVVNDYTEPADYEAPEDRPRRRFASGTIALQGHDPGSEVHYRAVRIRLLD